jgi:hypothetical protein
MSIQRFSLAAVEQVRQQIQNAIVVQTDKQSEIWADLEDTDDIPEPKSLDDLNSIFTFGGLSSEEVAAPQLKPDWSISTINPAAALLKLPGLQLKPTQRLVSYLYQEGSNRAGLVFAVPEALATTAQLEKALAKSGDLKQPPQPEGVSPDFMEAIAGNHSAVSYVVASLLYRELREFGAAGRYRNWSYHRLIDKIPSQVAWQWQVEQPKDLAPKAKVLPDGQAIVEFFTCRISAGVALYRHIDQYPAGQYTSKRLNKALATPQR